MNDQQNQEIINLKDMSLTEYKQTVLEYLLEESAMYHDLSKNDRYKKDREIALQKYNLIRDMCDFITTGNTGRSLKNTNKG